MKRVTILISVKRALENDLKANFYLCNKIANMIANKCNRSYSPVRFNLQNIFPLFNMDEANKFSNIKEVTEDVSGVWFYSNEERLEFLNYLIKQYKYDEEDINKIMDKLNIKKI